MMDPNNLLRLLNRIYCYMPHDNPITGEIKSIMDNIKSQREQLPPVEIVNEP
jgi:hypothetical protein